MKREFKSGMEVLSGLPPAQAAATVTVVGAEMVTVTKTSGTAGKSFEEEVNRRAETVTVVLTKILEHPASVRHWGINE